MTTPAAYPVSVEAQLSPNLSRGLWLVKWLLAIPHYVILIFLAIAAFFLTIYAFFAILFKGQYPRGIFNFNLGVLRWCWRVDYYAFSAFGTDRYPPFSLQETDYPAKLDVPYPEKLSKGLVLVKWWLLAIPHYIVLSVLSGGLGPFYVGLTTVLALFGAVALLFTGKYQASIFDLVMGFNRWIYRVAAYAMLMRDEYPPFRLEP